jgi:hypothetical protein
VREYGRCRKNRIRPDQSPMQCCVGLLQTSIQKQDIEGNRRRSCLSKIAHQGGQGVSRQWMRSSPSDSLVVNGNDDDILRRGAGARKLKAEIQERCLKPVQQRCPAIKVIKPQ